MLDDLTMENIFAKYQMGKYRDKDLWLLMHMDEVGLIIGLKTILANDELKVGKYIRNHAEDLMDIFMRALDVIKDDSDNKLFLSIRNKLLSIEDENEIFIDESNEEHMKIVIKIFKEEMKKYSYLEILEQIKNDRDILDLFRIVSKFCGD